MREKSTLATIARRSAFAVAGLVLGATMDVASASTSMESAGNSARLAVQSVRLAEAVATTKSKNVKKTKKVRGSGKTWLNPQPEPPMGPAKVDKGGTWLNPQPEPPRPVTGSKKLN
jgi:hypothetical protein